MQNLIELVSKLGRFIMPVIALYVLFRCVISLLRNCPKVQTLAYLVNGANGDNIPLNHWETSIGRSKSCDITLFYSTVSRFHAVISKRKKGWVVSDTFSKTGVYVNGEKVHLNSYVYDGDSIALGNAVLFLSAPDCPPPIERLKKQEEEDRETESTHDIPTRKSFDIHTSALLIDGEASPYFLLRDSYIIGRSEESDIVLNYPSVSRTHAKLIHMEEGWVIEDTNSQVGTIVNGQPIIQRQLLFDDDVITIGIYNIVFKEDYTDYTSLQ